MATRADIAAEALAWVGTPYVHQGSLKGVGCDCAGLVRGVALRFALVKPEALAAFEAYGRLPDGRMADACDSLMQRIGLDKAGAGDVVLMDRTTRGGTLPHHLGILVDYPAGGLAIVHATASPPRVACHRLAPSLRASIVAAYRLPGVSA